MRRVRIEDFPPHVREAIERAGTEKRGAAIFAGSEAEEMEAAHAAPKKRKARKPVVVNAEVFCVRCGSFEHDAAGCPPVAQLARRFVFAVPVRTENVANGSHGNHFAEAGRRDQVRSAIGAAWRAQGMFSALRPRWRVTITRISAGELDEDNLALALKSCRDELAARMKVDDASPLVQWVRRQERGAPGQPAVRIEVEELP